MHYSPHTLQEWREERTQNEEGYFQVTGAWNDIGTCRCDDAGNQTLTGEDGVQYNPLYKVVCMKDIKKGTKYRALENGIVRGEGIADKPQRLNYLRYSIFYLV